VLLVAPAFGDSDLGTYVRAILTGMDIRTEVFGYAKEPRASLQRKLLAACRTFEPTAVLGLKLDRVEPDTLRRIRRSGVRVVLWYVDCLGPAPPAWILPRMRECDAVFVTARGMVQTYRARVPAPVHWVMEGVHTPAFPPLEVTAAERRLFGSDVAFVGAVYYPTTDHELFHGRARLLRAIQARHDLKIWGPQRYQRGRARGLRIIEWPAYNHDFVRICRSSRIVLGMNRINTVELYFSNRTFLTLASGGFHLTHYVPGLETMFRNHEHLVWFHSTSECLELVDHYLARPAQAATIAECGRAFVRRRFSMVRQVRRMLGLANLLPGLACDA
jgi:hypothetical protein